MNFVDALSLITSTRRASGHATVEQSSNVLTYEITVRRRSRNETQGTALDKKLFGSLPLLRISMEDIAVRSNCIVENTSMFSLAQLYCDGYPC